MKVLLYGNTTTNQLSTQLTGGAVSLADIRRGDTLTLPLRLSESVDGTTALLQGITFTSAKIGLGAVDARPSNGTFALKTGTSTTVVGTNCTIDVQYNVDPDSLQAALNGLSALTSGQKGLDGGPTVIQTGSSWLVFSADGTRLNLSVGDNRLYPVCLVRVREFQTPESKWVSEIRLVQTPVCASSGVTTVVPDPPTITRIKSGFTNGINTGNEIQALNTQPSFQNSFECTRGANSSKPLNVSSRASDIQSALQKIADLGGSFAVTVAKLGQFWIEFLGSMAGASQPLLGLSVVGAGTADLTLSLLIKSAELDAMLRAQAALVPNSKGRIELPLEIEVVYTDLNSVSHTASFSTSLAVYLEMWSDELEVVPEIDWVHPPQPESYVPFNESQVITGQHAYPFTFGDGVSEIYPITHLQGTTLLCSICIHPVGANARVYVLGTDFTAQINDENSITITLLAPPPPGMDALSGVFNFAPALPTFAEGLTIEAGQVNMPGGGTLADFQTTVVNSIAALNTALGINPFSSAPSAATAAIQGQTWTLRQYASVFGVKSPVGAKDTSAIKLGPANPIAAIDPATLPGHGGGLLAAIRTSTFTGVSALPDSPATGVRYVNTGSDPITIPPGLSHALAVANVGDSFAWSGSVFYKLQQYAQDTQFKSSAITISTSTAFCTISAGSYTAADGDVVQLQTTGTLPAGFSLNTDYTVSISGGHTQLKLLGTIVTPSTVGTGTHSIGLSAPANAWWYPEMDVYLGGFACNSAQLRLGLQLSINVGFEIGLIFGTRDIAQNLEGAFQYVFVMEWQPIVSDTAPIPGANLGALAWHPVPLLAQPIVLSAVPVVCGFGVTILRQLVASVDTITATQNVFGGSSGALSAPSQADLRFRFRLIRGDTPDSKPAPRGFIAVRGMSLNAQGTDGTGSGIGLAQISQIQA